MKKKAIFKNIIFYTIFMAIIIPSFQYACETNFLYNLVSDTFTSDEVKNFLKNEYSNGVELKEYKIDRIMIKIKEEDSKPVLYYYFITKYSREQEDLISDEISQIYNKMRKKDEISEYFYKIRFRAMKGNEVIYKYTYKVVNWTMDRLIYLSLSLIVIFAVRMYFRIRAWIKGRSRKKFLGGNEIYEYSMAELMMYIQTSPKDDRAHFRLSQLYLSNGNIVEALNYIGEANKLNPCEREYIIHYGHIMILLKDYNEALGRFNSLVKLRTFFNDYDLLFWVGFLYAKKGKKNTALRYYRHAYRVCKKRRFYNNPEAQAMKKNLECNIL